MALYHLELCQNNEILNRNRYWRTDSFGFVIEVQVQTVLGSSNRTYFQDDRVFLTESGMRQFLFTILSAEQMSLNSGRFFLDNRLQLIRQIPQWFSPRITVVSLDSLVLSVLEMTLLMRNSHRNRSRTLLPIQFTLNIIEIRQSRILDDSFILDGESLGGGLQRLDDSVILEGRPVGLSSTAAAVQRLDDSVILEGRPVGLSSTAAAVQLLKEERVESSDTECSICLESVVVGETVAVMPCSHLFHRGCITRWLQNKPSCPLCRAPAC